ncbi:hypothetical protein BG005_000001 [Podila minutissima]|nr:hypothetical protein BG005_000001 [Podila minutissima]
MTVSIVWLTPYPLCIGRNVCVHAMGTLSNEITSTAWVSIVGKYLGRTVYTDSQSACALFNERGYPCPIPTNIARIVFCLRVKSSFPASVNIPFTISVTNGFNVLFCQSGTVSGTNCVV